MSRRSVIASLLAVAIAACSAAPASIPTPSIGSPLASSAGSGAPLGSATPSASGSSASASSDAPTTTSPPTDTTPPPSTETAAPATEPTAPPATTAPTLAPTRPPTAPPTAAVASVVYLNFTANPAVLQIAAGTTVVWTNMDSVPHTVTSGANRQPNGIFNSGSLAPMAQFRFKFTTAGTYVYFCAFHASMTGFEVVVR